jgi:hypothetical protein
MAFFDFMHWTFVINIKKGDMKQKVIIGNIEDHILIIFSKFDDA